jgi:hypothetical protein
MDFSGTIASVRNPNGSDVEYTSGYEEIQLCMPLFQDAKAFYSSPLCLPKVAKIPPST